MTRIYFTEIWSYEVLDLSFLVQVWPTLSPNLPPMVLSVQWLRRKYNFSQGNYSTDVRFGSKMSQIGLKWAKSGAIPDQISVHFGSQIWKYPGLSTFEVKLTHFGAKLDSPESACGKCGHLCLYKPVVWCHWRLPTLTALQNSISRGN